MIDAMLRNYIAGKQRTLLGVGPMSVNCVDATIEIANDYDFPLMLIASRRQIDSKELGGGYVNNWSTEDFAEYVLKRDINKKILLARDHGGPWQNTKEIDANLSLKSAMESAKNSYSTDIEAGFNIIHIDPSIDIHGKPNAEEIMSRVFELYSFCWEEAQKKGNEIIFEIGTEEQSGSTNTQEELEYTLQSITAFCTKNSLPTPTFVVIQCGTKVMEMRNVGSFDSPIRIANETAIEIQLPKMIEICNKYNVLMKEHNTDYLSDDSLHWHPRLGIHAANVAPEFGVAESKAFVDILQKNGLKRQVEKFLSLSYESNKWAKWIIKESDATDYDKSIIAGHYIFSTPNFIELRDECESLLRPKGIDQKGLLKEAVKRSIMRYCRNFRLVL